VMAAAVLEVQVQEQMVLLEKQILEAVQAAVQQALLDIRVLEVQVLLFFVYLHRFIQVQYQVHQVFQLADLIQL